MDALAAEIGAAGTAEVDALDEQAVNTDVDSLAEQAGRLDISTSSATATSSSR